MLEQTSTQKTLWVPYTLPIAPVTASEFEMFERLCAAHGLLLADVPPHLRERANRGVVMSDDTPQKTPQPTVSEYEMRKKALSFAMTHRVGRVFGKTIDEELAAAMTLKSAEEFLRFLKGQPQASATSASTGFGCVRSLLPEG